MAVPELLLGTLNKLGNKDFATFQWWLLLAELDGGDPIPKHHLENQPREATVSVMIDRYGEERAVDVTLAVLEKMRFNNIREKLRKAYTEQNPASPSSFSSSSSSSSSASASPSASGPPGAPITIKAQQGSVVIFPNISAHSTVGTLNITIDKP